MYVRLIGILIALALLVVAVLMAVDSVRAFDRANGGVNVETVMQQQAIATLAVARGLHALLALAGGSVIGGLALFWPAPDDGPDDGPDVTGASWRFPGE